MSLDLDWYCANRSRSLHIQSLQRSQKAMTILYGLVIQAGGGCRDLLQVLLARPHSVLQIVVEFLHFC